MLDYQPGWVAVPLGALELGLVMALAVATGVRAPLDAAVAFFVAAWLLAQVLGARRLPVAAPLVRRGRRRARPAGRVGRARPSPPSSSRRRGVAFATRPPTVTLSAGVHQGPLVIDREETLVGEPGAVVRGGIVVRASGVTVRNVTVVGGENGITSRARAA